MGRVEQSRSNAAKIRQMRPVWMIWRQSQANWATPSLNSSATVPRLFDTASHVATRSVVTNCSVLSTVFEKTALHTDNWSQWFVMSFPKIMTTYRTQIGDRHFTSRIHKSRQNVQVDLLHRFVSWLSVQCQVRAYFNALHQTFVVDCTAKCLKTWNLWPKLTWCFRDSTECPPNCRKTWRRLCNPQRRFPMSHNIILARCCSNFTDSRVW